MLSVKESTNDLLSPSEIFSKSGGEGSKNVADLVDHVA